MPLRQRIANDLMRSKLIYANSQPFYLFIHDAIELLNPYIDILLYCSWRYDQNGIYVR